MTEYDARVCYHFEPTVLRAAGGTNDDDSSMVGWIIRAWKGLLGGSLLAQSALELASWCKASTVAWSHKILAHGQQVSETGRNLTSPKLTGLSLRAGHL